MNDRPVSDRAVLERLGKYLDSGREAVLVTVVAVEGRAYRRPGARMLATPGGEVGMVTPGCVESEVRKVVDSVLAAGEPRVETYDLTSEEDVWGLGLGCEGVVTLLLEPVGEKHRGLVDAHEAASKRFLPVVIESEDGRFAVGERTDLDHPSSVPERVVEHLQSVEADDPRIVEIETERGAVSAFLDRIEPPPDLLLVGNGHDLRPIADLAADLDFRVTVAGFRGGEASEERFPGADRVVSTSPRSLTDEVGVGEETYAVLATHNAADDRLALDALLDTPAPYVGVMGPRERFEEIREALAEGGRRFTREDLGRIYAPVGLDLGGGDPREVAHSVVAEILAVRNDRTGGHLREVRGPIHDRAATDQPAE